ncbi:uncharacterized protein B0H18DRAFT_1039514 [Fomitopsis serialis]|uniref:uncharacterized protein n=1 Tax=Fomitopsis serialis TaxID=139415 RepID=UPI0020076A8B|nr:uncharacterized protein B0H18DRAFT_1039514 [Neoantrodia serialis]KAH9915988.1 hypothetical protein B0H18DRAFT_1039514 [Neoantrodia serialis]
MPHSFTRRRIVFEMVCAPSPELQSDHLSTTALRSASRVARQTFGMMTEATLKVAATHVPEDGAFDPAILAMEQAAAANGLHSEW